MKTISASLRTWQDNGAPTGAAVAPLEPRSATRERSARRSGPRLGHAALPLVLALAWFGVAPAPAIAQDQNRVPNDVQTFEQLLGKLQKARNGGTTNADVEQLLALARKVGRPYVASLVARDHLRGTLAPPPSLLLLAAENAYLSGDHKTAVQRYRAYLRHAPSDAQASEVVARTTLVLLDVLDSKEDAYRFQADEGSRFRHSPAARKFDGWFIAMAREKKDYAAMTERLLLVLEEQNALELERVAIWPLLDELMSDLQVAGRETFRALPALPKLIPLVRDAHRQRRFEFIHQNLRFVAASAGRDQRELDQQFQAVSQAAQTYFDGAPTRETLEDILATFSARFNNTEWERQRGQKRDFCRGIFAKLADEDRAWLRRWQYRNWLWEDAQWVDLVTEYPGLLAFCGDRDLLSLLPHLSKPEHLAKQATVLQGQRSRYAQLVTAAAVSTDLAVAADALLQHHGWHLNVADIHKVVGTELWALCRAVGGVKAADEAALYSKAMAEFGAKHIAGTPVALFDTAAAADAVLQTMRHTRSAADGTAALGALVDALRWVPYSEEERATVFAPARDEFKAWREAATSGTTTAGPDAERLNRMQEILNNALQPNGAFDPAIAPTPLAGALARTLLAGRAGKRDTYLEGAQEILRLVRDFEEKRIPFGAAAFAFAVGNNLADGDVFEHQAATLKELMDRFDPGKHDLTVSRLFNALAAGRWPDYRQIPNGDIQKARRLAELTGAGLMRLLEAGTFSPRLLDLFRATRSGQGWFDRNIGLAVMAKIIESRAFITHDIRPFDANRSITWNTMRLMMQEFPELHQGKFNVHTAFDDMFLEEAAQSNRFDWGYWDYGHDRDWKVRDAVSRRIQQTPTVPDGAPFDSMADFWRWSSRCNAGGSERPKLLAHLESTYGKTRFDADAMGAAYFAADLNLSAGQARSDFLRNLAQFIGRSRTLPVRVPLPSLAALGSIKDATALGADDTQTLFASVTSYLELPAASRDAQRRWHYEALVPLLHEALLAANREGDLFEFLPVAWSIARDMRQPDLSRTLGRMANESLRGKRTELAMVHSVTGLNMLGPQLPDDVTTQLTAVRSSAANQIGGIIPVPQTDLRYPIYASQAAYFINNLSAAWSSYLVRPQLFTTVFKDLDPEYSIWIIDKNTEAMDFETADTFAREMMRWFDENPTSFTPEIRARLLVAYANIAFTRREFARARAQLGRIIASKEFDGTRSKSDADLMLAEIERLTRNFDEAVIQLDKLSQRNDRYVQTEAFYQLAMVRFDQEEFVQASDTLDRVFMLNPEHANARILQGKIFLQRKKLIEATEIDLGIATAQRVLVPNTPLRVKLEDLNLAVVGRTSNAEIRVWTDSGDEESFNLFPFGDSRTRFEGQIPTRLAPTVKGDRILQVVGGDNIHYDFSERFKKAANITTSALQTLSVVTDAELHVSSGRILTREEQEEAMIEEMIRDRIERRAGRDITRPDAVALSTVRPRNQVKPGNPINVRVVDPDRSTSGGVDEIHVAVATNYYRLPNFTLRETETHSGIFEGAIPTVPAPPAAFASDSEEGRQPNWVVSPQDTPAWKAVPDNRRPKVFGVDLRDNVALGKMSILAKEPGHKLKGFILQTSMNGTDFFTRATWPMKMQVWDGSLEMHLVKAPANLSGGYETFIETGGGGGEADGFKASVWPKSCDVEIDRTLFGNEALLKLERESWFVAHFRGAFHVPERQVRTFKLEHGGRLQNITYVFTINREPSLDARNPYEIRRSLPEGVHFLDVYVYAHRNAQPTFRILSGGGAGAELELCTPDMFDPKQHPQIREAVFQSPATILPGDQNTAFSVEFPADARARMVRLVLTDFEGEAPAINKIRLTDRETNLLLPVRQELLQVGQEENLPVVPGDRISVTYVDPTFVSPGNDVHETTLDVTFHNAVLQASFVEFIDTPRGREAQYIPMYRFVPGEPITIFVNDPDEDVTDSPDTVAVAVQTTSGKSIAVRALETDRHTGIFTTRVFPVRTAPQRPTEIQVSPEDEIIVGYLDKENTDYGIPWERRIRVEQAIFHAPELRVFTASTEPVQGRDGAGDKGHRVIRPSAADDRERPPVNLVLTRPARPETGEPASVAIDGPFVFELLFPTIALAETSQAEVYVQTESGRQLAGKTGDGAAFDIGVPGTLRVVQTPGDVTLGTADVPPVYSALVLRGLEAASDPVLAGRFTLQVDFQLGAPTDAPRLEGTPWATRPGATLPGADDTPPPILMVKGNDTIHIGFKYRDGNGDEKWLTQRVDMRSSAVLQAMDRRFETRVDGIYLGEALYLQVIDLEKDTTSDRDQIEIAIVTGRGHKAVVPLVETFDHTGDFRSIIKPVYDNAAEGAAATEPQPAATAEAEPAAAAAEPQPAAAEALGDASVAQVDIPVVYGDTITASYLRRDGEPPLECRVTIFKGSDGLVAPFTKRYSDAEMGVQTQFTIAECYFELAKKHRSLGQDALARRGIAQGKRLLEEAIADITSGELRAHADYLLANLAMEFGDDAQNEEIKLRHYMEAVSLFTDIVIGYPDSAFAPKAQFKKALTLEKMNEFDLACEEYVKLSYRYPDNELVAETIARLGQYFWRQANDFRREAEGLKDAVAAERVKQKGKDMFVTAGEVFVRLGERFPQHELSEKTLVLAAQAYMGAEDYVKAVELFKSSIERIEKDRDLIAEAMYWCGDSYLRMGGADTLIEAYRVFKRLTWEYPESRWAKFARGQLADPKMQKLDTE